MEIRADLHIHSKYARATSPLMDLEHLDEFGKKKGLNVIATGDFTHPKWFKEIETKLVEDKGLYKLKNINTGLRFILSTEISSIFRKNNKCYRSHNLILFSNIDSVRNFNKNLIDLKCNLNADGRPIVGLEPKKLLEIAMECDKKFMFIPAHIWTPWFSLFGSKSGFDNLEDCFEEFTPFIHTCETGISSDIIMNRRVKQLDNINLISNSDCHSLEKLGRECNVFDCDLSYDGIYNILNTSNSNKFLYTIEFYPEEGRYHYDGHRNCKICLSPEETRKNNGLCPKCGKPLIVGVLNRVEQLSSRSEKEVLKFNKNNFKYIIPLREIISQMFGVGVNSLKVINFYDKLLEKFSNELDILLKVDYEDFVKNDFEIIGKLICKMRLGEVDKTPGYDGDYGVINIK